jgi:phosphate transport system permease protein
MMTKFLARNRHTVQRLGFIAITLMALFTVLPIIGTILFIISKGGSAISVEFLTGFPHDGMRAGGILPAIIGTLYLTIGTAIFSVPLGIAAAIYLSEYAKDNRLTRIIRLAIINLAGIPSVVYGNSAHPFSPHRLRFRS